MKGYRQSYSLEEGLIASTVGTLHRPNLIDLCGGREIRIPQPPESRRGTVGQWKPMLDTSQTTFQVAPRETIMSVDPEFMVTDRGVVHKYAFSISLSSRNTLSDVSVDVLGNFIDSVLLLLEGELLNHFYDALIQKETTRIGTQELGSETRDGTKYELDEYAWRGLRKSFGKNHGLTDVFCHETYDGIIHSLPLTSAATITVDSSGSLIDLRNRIKDGTYVWSHFLDEPEETRSRL